MRKSGLTHNHSLQDLITLLLPSQRLRRGLKKFQILSQAQRSSYRDYMIEQLVKGARNLWIEDWRMYSSWVFTTD